jgi:hypothetical protein
VADTFSQYKANHLQDVEAGRVMRLSDATLRRRFNGDWSGGLNASEMFRDQSKTLNRAPAELYQRAPSSAGVTRPRRAPQNAATFPSAAPASSIAQTESTAGGSAPFTPVQPGVVERGPSIVELALLDSLTREAPAPVIAQSTPAAAPAPSTDGGTIGAAAAIVAGLFLL